MIKKDVILGIVIAIIFNLIGMIIYITIVMNNELGLFENLNNAKQNNYLSKIISLGSIINIIPFSYFIYKKQDYKARGVLLATTVTALATFIIKLF